MSRLAWFKFYPTDFTGDSHVQEMTTAGVGAYVLLICFHWQEGSLPVDEKRLARIAKMSLRNFRAVWPSIEPCLTEVDLDGCRRYIQKRVSAEHNSAVSQSETNSINGTKGADIRWGKNGKRYSEAIASQIPDTRSQKPAKKTPPTPRKRGGRSGRKGDLSKPPAELQTPEFLEAWEAWGQHLKDRGNKKRSPGAVSGQLKKLDRMGEQRAIAALNHSIAGNYTGIFEDSNNSEAAGAKLSAQIQDILHGGDDEPRQSTDRDDPSRPTTMDRFRRAHQALGDGSRPSTNGHPRGSRLALPPHSEGLPQPRTDT